MNKSFKRWNLFVICLLAFSLALTACGNTPPENQSKSTANTSSSDKLTGSSAERAVQAAKQYAGQTVSLTYEAGLQAANPIGVQKMWEEATGVKLEVIQLPNSDLYTKAINSHISGGQVADVMLTQPNWVPDFINSGLALDDLSPYINKYANPEDLAQLPESYKPLVVYNDKQVGLLTDGDVQILYYRKDWFDDANNKANFKKEYGYDLAPPKTWLQLDQIAKFFTDQGQGKYFGFTIQNAPGQVYEFFNQTFGGLGGQYFDPETMKPLINGPIAVQALENMVYLSNLMPPGGAKYDFVQAMTPFLAGNAAMMYSWAPIGKFVGGMAKGQEALQFVPESKVVGKVGFTTPPGTSNFSAGFELMINATSKNKDLAYLFAQWYTSPEIHKIWISFPTSLGKPTYTNEFTDKDIANLFPDANEWALAIQEAVDNNPHPDLIIPGSNDYHIAVDQAVTSALAGADPQAALDTAAKKWEEITNRLGLEQQKKAYQNFVKYEQKGLGEKESGVPPTQ